MQQAAIVGRLSGLSQDRIQELASFRQSLVRDLNPDSAYTVIGAAINFVAVRYGVRKEPEHGTLDECIRLVGSKFNYLSPVEIKEAYRMWAAGKLEIGSSAEMWGGEINARNLGAVLSAYAEWRKKDMAKYLSAVQQEREEKTREEKTAKAKAEFETNLFAELDEAVKDYEDWKQVKPYWFSALWKRKLISMTDEQIEQIKVDATEEAKKERENREKTARDEGKLFEQVAEAEGIEKAMRCRLAVWRHYILPKRENPNNDNE